MRDDALKIKADDTLPKPREIERGTVWEEIARMDPKRELTFRVCTTRTRKLQRVLPSGRTVRVFREGEAFKHRAIATGDQDTHDFRLEVRDALFLYRDPQVKIEFQRERIDLDPKE